MVVWRPCAESILCSKINKDEEKKISPKIETCQTHLGYCSHRQVLIWQRQLYATVHGVSIAIFVIQSSHQSSQDDNRTVPIYQPTCDAYHQCMRIVVSWRVFITDLQTSGHNIWGKKSKYMRIHRPQDLIRVVFVLSQQLDTTVVLAYVCSLFIRRTLI